MFIVCSIIRVYYEQKYIVKQIIFVKDQVQILIHDQINIVLCSKNILLEQVRKKCLKFLHGLNSYLCRIAQFIEHKLYFGELTYVMLEQVEILMYTLHQCLLLRPLLSVYLMRNNRSAINEMQKVEKGVRTHM